jgi:hypothetical protein
MGCARDRWCERTVPERPASVFPNTIQGRHHGNSKSRSAQMTVAQIDKAGVDFQIVDREVPSPGAGYVRIKLQDWGVCHSNVFTKEGA